jgi:hypothetical protein
MNLSIYMPQLGHGRDHGHGLIASFRAAGHQVIACASEFANAADGVGDRDGLIIYGLRGGARRLTDDYLDAGRPVVVLEMGYLGDREAFLGMSRLTPEVRVHNRNSALLLQERPLDRLQALGVEVGYRTPKGAAVEKRGPGRPSLKKGIPEACQEAPLALILGQVPGDSQLGGQDAMAWSAAQAEDMTAAGWAVVTRPHPVVRPPDRPLDADLKRADLCISFNSTSIARCIELGVPFLCAPECQYFPMAGKESKPQTVREQFLARLAYLQYNATECADGTAARFIEEIMGTVK